jgi:TonB family protein
VNWYSLIPEAARLRQVRGRVVIIFTITKNGNVEGQRIVANSEYQSLDNAAIGSIMASNPFPRIPDDFEGNSLVLQFTFLYNMQ